MIRLLAEHRVAANLLMTMMVLAGLFTMKSIPSQLDPPSSFPLIWVEVEWRGAAAEDIEELITTPIESQLRTLNDLHELRSSTSNGYVRVNAIFNHDADMTLALDAVKQRVDNLRNLPPTIEPPKVRRYIDLEPVASLLVHGGSNVSELIPLVREFENDLMQRGIEGVWYDGLPTEEIAILVGGDALQQMNLTLDELASEIARASQNVPAGSVGRGQGERQLRSLDQRRNPRGFEGLLLETSDQLVRLGDFANIVRRPQDGQPLVRKDGKPAIEMILWRDTGSDAMLAAKVVQTWLADIQPNLPEGVVVEQHADIWHLLEAQISMIGKNAAGGLFLVIFTLLLFLNGRVGFWVMLGIPVSFLLALALFYYGFGYGISIIGMIGFIMALGIVVDDAIVVGEDAMTHFENGASPEDAAVMGAQRMWVPVVTSSLTTLAAFIPLLLIGGTMGDVILILPTILFCVIIASLIECFCVLPGHLKRSLAKVKPTPPDSFRGRFDTAFATFREQKFMPLVHRSLAYPGVTVCTALGGVVCAFALVASQHVGFNMVTGFNFESLEAHTQFSSEATDADKEDFVQHLQQTLQQVHKKYDSQNLVGWLAKDNLAKFDDERQTGAQFASISAFYAFEEDRTVAPQRFANEWRDLVTQPPWVERLYLGVDGGANGGEPTLSMVLRGDNLDNLKSGAEELAGVLASYPGVSNVSDNLPYGKEQLIFTMTPTGKSLGLTPEAIGRQLRAGYAGQRVQIFNENNSELEVRVLAPDAERDNLAYLAQYPIKTPASAQNTAGDNGWVPLGSVATLTPRRGIDLIRHHNGELAIRISADVDSKVNNALTIIEDIKSNHIETILGSKGLTFGLAGQSAEDAMMLETMALGGLLTLVLIYLILAWVFASYLWPLAIMLAIPFGLTGAIVGHWVLGMDLGAMSILAFFSLTGIVVNDSIVLISFFKDSYLQDGEQQSFDKAHLRATLANAVNARFRAVLLTSLTTIAGLVALIFETSTLQMYVAPIAVTLCFGLAFATALVLLVIPAMVLLLEDGKHQLLALVHSTTARLRAPTEVTPTHSHSHSHTPTPTPTPTHVVTGETSL